MSIEIGKRVLQIRQSMNLNQRDFASLLGVSTGGVSQVESGKAMPGGDFLLKIHQALGVDITWLLTGMSTNPKSVFTPSLPPDKQALVDAYDSMSSENKRAILQIGSSLSQSKSDREAG
ncbi:DNA-binding protein [Providencia stuartii]|uniref:DNA-binding protein n=1 Tax=Providencia stuartii TaxID=588 RepID=A0A1S1HVC1_PROST|nr:DNA-binding protein [Providencia stuartii]